MPSPSKYLDSLTVIIHGTDGYTSVEEEITIHISLIPINFILKFIASFVSPLFGLFGVWKFRSFAYNIIYKKNYKY